MPLLLNHLTGPILLAYPYLVLVAFLHCLVIYSLRFNALPASFQRPFYIKDIDICHTCTRAMRIMRCSSFSLCAAKVSTFSPLVFQKSSREVQASFDIVDAANDNFELLILPPLPSEFWDSRCALLCLASRKVLSQYHTLTVHNNRMELAYVSQEFEICVYLCFLCGHDGRLQNPKLCFLCAHDRRLQNPKLFLVWPRQETPES